jgi:beta-galactosidase
VPLATNLIHFELNGPGKIIGVGNGDPTCHEPDTFVPKPNFEVTSENEGWDYKLLPDVKNPLLAELQPGFDDSSWDKIDTQANADSMKEPGQAVFRTKISVDADELTAQSVELKIGRIDDQGWVYINGKLAGESRDWASSPSFDIKRFLHVGENAVAIAIINRDGSGGLGNGVTLRIFKKAAAPLWQRSVFNGLAQVIVQSAHDAGEVMLTATAVGLTSASALIQTKEGKLRQDMVQAKTDPAD